MTETGNNIDRPEGTEPASSGVKIGDAPSEAQVIRLPAPLRLTSGAELNNVDVAYETFGELNKSKTNVVLICHALTGDSHVTRLDSTRAGWWEDIVGPDLAIDTNQCFVICANVLGGCSGTTGPATIDEASAKPYGSNFPLITIEDMVHSQAAMLDQLGIENLAAVVGGSMGGMQALAWGKLYPSRVHSVVADATTPRLSAQGIGFNEIGRRAILEDPAYNNGDYYNETDQPDVGLAIARMIGHLTYLSDESMWKKFGRRLRERDAFAYDFAREFEVETYLEHQGNKFIERFDANSYLYVTRATDYFDLSSGHDSLVQAVQDMPEHFLVMSFSSDWLFPTYQARELVSALLSARKSVSYAEVKSPYGHDAFLLEVDQTTQLIKPFIENALVACASKSSQ